MPEIEEKLKRTPLFDEHVALNARMVGFGGWNMPVQYEGILNEYKQTREATSLFDISHMGEFLIEGDCEQSGLDRILTMSLKDLPVRASRYGAILNEKGCVIDDTICFRINETRWFVVVNGATTEKDVAHFKTNLNDPASFEDVSLSLGKLDLQGPFSRDILKKHVKGIEKLNYYSFDYFELLGENVLISRTGYTGELGYEIFFPWNKTKELWNTLLSDERVKPAGLGARDILRLEMGYSLYGHELGEDISPLESGLERFINFEKDFIGKEALLKEKEQGSKRKIVGFISDSRRSPRADQKIYSQAKEDIGVVTSGSFSPSTGKGIGLGLVAIEQSDKGNKILFGDDKGKNSATITGKIFYKDGSLRN